MFFLIRYQTILLKTEKIYDDLFVGLKKINSQGQETHLFLGDILRIKMFSFNETISCLFNVFDTGLKRLDF